MYDVCYDMYIPFIAPTNIFECTYNITCDCGLHSTLENYAKWQLILSYIPTLSSDFVSAFDSFSLATTGQGLRQRYQTCLSVVEAVMPIALARPFTDYILPPGTKVHIRVIFTYKRSSTQFFFEEYYFWQVVLGPKVDAC